MALVLCTGVHETLVETRKMLLELAGHTVVTALGEIAARKACNKHQFDIAVIGQSISMLEKQRLFEIVREHCSKTKILELYRGRKLLPEADDWLEAPVDVPSDLPHRVKLLTSRRAAS